MLTAKERLELAMMQPTAELLTQVGSSPRGLSQSKLKSIAKLMVRMSLPKPTRLVSGKKFMNPLLTPSPSFC